KELERGLHVQHDGEGGGQQKPQTIDVSRLRHLLPSFSDRFLLSSLRPWRRAFFHGSSADLLDWDLSLYHGSVVHRWRPFTTHLFDQRPGQPGLFWLGPGRGDDLELIGRVPVPASFLSASLLHVPTRNAYADYDTSPFVMSPGRSIPTRP